MSYQSRIYLFRSDVETFSRAVAVTDGWEQRPIKCSEFVEAEFWIKPNVEAEPRWKTQYSESVDLSDIDPNRQTSSVLLVRVDGRVFAECMGYGHSLLDKYWVQEDFGLVLASQFVSVTDLRAVGIRTYGPYPTSTVVRSPKPGRLEAFLPNPVFTQLSLLDGMPNNERRARGENSRMEGNFGFKECSPFTTCDERVERFRTYLAVYQRGSALPPSYVVSQPKPIPMNHETSQELYAALLAVLGEGLSNDVDIMLPDEIDAEASGADIYLRTGQREHLLGEISWPAISAALGNDGSLSINRLRSARLELRGSGVEPMSEPLLSCIYFEVANGNDLFVHGYSGWQRFSRQIIQVLDSTLDECEAQSNVDDLPSWDPQWEEGEYNRRVALKMNWLYLDKDLWRAYRGASGVEICDLENEAGALIHVKRFRNTQSVAQVVHQATTSATALTQQAGAQEWLWEREAEHWGSPRNTHLRKVILGIATEKAGRVSEFLPVASKHSLVQAISRLRQLGMQPVIRKIAIEDVVQVVTLTSLPSNSKSRYPAIPKSGD